MQVLFLIAMMPIVIADFRHHVIPNVYLKILAACLCISWIIHGFPQPKFNAWCLLVSCLLVMARFGMGDVKLLVILLLTFQPQIALFAAFLAFFSVVHILMSSVRNRAIPASLPLAPAIFSALVTYLATR